MPLPPPARLLFTSLIAVVQVVALPSTASADVTRAQAGRLAVRAAGVPANAPLLVHGEPRPIAAGSRIAESARTLPFRVSGGGGGIPAHGARMLVAPRLLTVLERSWLFLIDPQPFAQHAQDARVVLVGVRSGRVQRSRPLRFAPLVNGVTPSFLRSHGAYRSARTRVAYRPLRANAVAQRLRSPVLRPRGASVRRLARSLGARRTCVFVFGESYGANGAAANVNASAAAVQTFFANLTRHDRRVRVLRYRLATGVSPTVWLSRSIRSERCRHALVYAAGAGAAVGPPTSIAVARGRIVGNTIGVLGMPGSGSSQGGGIHLGATGAATHIAYVAGNEISNVHGIGITAQVGDACPYGCPAVIGHGEYTIADNTISEPGDGAGNAIMLNHGTTSVDAMTSCLELSGNVLGGWVNGVDQIRLRQRQATTVRLRGYAGAPHDLSAVAAHARAANGDATASAATAPTGGGFTGTAGGMSCQIPPELT